MLKFGLGLNNATIFLLSISLTILSLTKKYLNTPPNNLKIYRK